MKISLKRMMSIFLAAVLCILPLSAVLAEEGGYIYDQATVPEVWQFVKERGDITPGDSGFETTTYDAVVQALYTGQTWADDYTYTLTLNSKNQDASNMVYVYFNYQDAENHYYFSVTSPASNNVITLYSVINGKSTVLGTFTNYSVNYQDTEFSIVYDHGNIRITGVKNGIPTDIFQVEDTQLTYGLVGFKTQFCRAVIKNISVSGTLYNAVEEGDYLSVQSTSMENGAQNVPAAGAVSFVMNGPLKAETVTKEHIVLEGASEGQYSVSALGETLTVAWEGLSYNTAYSIVLGPGLQLEETGLGFKNGEYVFTFHTQPGEGYMDYAYSMEQVNNDWSLTNAQVLTINENGMMSSDYSATVTAVLHAYSWRDQYTYSAVLNNRSGDITNKMILYFNYRGSSDYYAISIGGAKEDNPVELYKMEGGERKTIASYANYVVNYQATVFEIAYNSGRITVTADKNGTKTTLFDVEGENSYGRVGIGLNTCSGSFEKMAVNGYGTDLHLRITDTNIPAGAEDVPVDTGLTFTFSEELDPREAVKENITITAAGQALPEDAYTLALGSSAAVLNITFAEALQPKTEYIVTFAPGLVSRSNGVGLSLGESVFAFKTRPPEFNVTAAAFCQGEPVKDVYECAGETVDFSVKLDNGQEHAQSYVLTVAIVAEDGKTLAIRYYAGNVEPDGAMEHNDAIPVPAEIGKGAKLVYFVWDGFQSMQVLYPSGTF